MASELIDHLNNILNLVWQRLPELVLIFIVGFIVIKLARLVIGSLIKVSRAKAALKDILLSVIDIALWMFLIAALFQRIGLTQIAFALSGFVAIAGLAISAGTSSLVQDLISGIFLAQDVDFNIGDKLKVGDVEGIVEKMDARKIRLRDKNGQLHVFPNSTFDKTAWVVQNKKGRA